MAEREQGGGGPQERERASGGLRRKPQGARGLHVLSVLNVHVSQ